MKHIKHVLIKTDFICIVCNKPSKWYSHWGGWLGDALDCKSCHNYIVYLNSKNELPLIWKDEIYLSKNNREVAFLRSYIENKTQIYINENKLTDLNHILKFDSAEHLLKRIESIIVFS